MNKLFVAVYLSGATCHEVQIGRLYLRFLKWRYWFWPRWRNGVWFRPNYFKWSLLPKDHKIEPLNQIPSRGPGK